VLWQCFSLYFVLYSTTVVRSEWILQFIVEQNRELVVIFRYSHGELVCIDDLQPFLDPDYRYIAIGGSNFWTLASFTTCTCFCRVMSLVWCSGHGVGHISKVKLRRARLVLGLMTTVGGPAIVVFFRPTQPGHPSMGRCNYYWLWSWSLLGEIRRVQRSSGPCNQGCWHTVLYASLTGSNPCRLKRSNGMSPSWRAPCTWYFDLAAKQPHTAQICRLMVCTVVIHVMTRFTTHLPTQKGWKAELAWLVDP